MVEKEGLSVDQAAKRLLVPKSSLGNWLRASRSGRLAKVGQGQQVPTEMELARLRKELAEKVGARPAKKVCCVFCEGVAVKYERIEQLRHQYPTAVLCRVMDISESGYHAW